MTGSNRVKGAINTCISKKIYTLLTINQSWIQTGHKVRILQKKGPWINVFAFKKGVKSIQTGGYNVVCKVFTCFFSHYFWLFHFFFSGQLWMCNLIFKSEMVSNAHKCNALSPYWPNYNALSKKNYFFARFVWKLVKVTFSFED